jgi:predicted transcriptional regulator
MIEPITTITGLIHLANLLWRIFKKIKTWLKNRDPLYKETNHFMKLLHDYAERNSHQPSE